MNGRVERISKRFYQGLWGVLTRWFRVPHRPPELPVLAGERVDSFQPAEGFLHYLKLLFWIGFVVIDFVIAVAWMVIAIASPVAGILTAPLALFLAIAPDIVAYLAIHLRYDTTWYVMTDRSLRIRRGIWVIHETTITFENVQNVSVRQGPLQRWFGIADVIVDTAGGGGQAQQAQHGGASMQAHRGLIEGVGDAHRIRDLLLQRLRRSSAAGLGDEVAAAAPGVAAWRPEMLVVLREIRDAARAAADS